MLGQLSRSKTLTTDRSGLRSGEGRARDLASDVAHSAREAPDALDDHLRLLEAVAEPHGLAGAGE